MGNQYQKIGEFTASFRCIESDYWAKFSALVAKHSLNCDLGRLKPCVKQSLKLRKPVDEKTRQSANFVYAPIGVACRSSKDGVFYYI